MVKKLRKHWFLFEELVKRDFTNKYKRTMLGMAWSVLSPLMTFLVMKVVFGHFFSASTPNYTTYLFCGNVLWSYFRESTTGGMAALVANADIFTKINVPKYMFVLSKSVSAFINFMLNLAVFFVFAACSGIVFSWRFLLLPYPILCFAAFCVGMSLVLSALYVFFKDMLYIYELFTILLMYMSAVFYSIDTFPASLQIVFHLNPVFVFIKYFRTVIIGGAVPPLWMHALCLFYALMMLLLGGYIYKRYNHEFLYYV